ncbi:fungal hydrophobin-domain-containing protein [Usnea florida]
MHFTTTTIIAILATTSFTTATPALTGDAKRNNPVLCSGADSSPNCCAVNVLGVVDLQCANPPYQPTSIDNFKQICAAIGQEAQCCTLDAAGQALLCENP